MLYIYIYIYIYIYNYVIFNEVQTEVHEPLFVAHVEQNRGIIKKAKKNPAKFIAIAEFKPHDESNCFCLTKINFDQYKFSIIVIDESISMDNQVSSYQNTRQLTLATVKEQAEMYEFYVITSDQSISANKLKTNENGSMSIQKNIKVFEDFSWRTFMFSKEVSLQNYFTQTLPAVLPVDNVSVFFS